MTATDGDDLVWYAAYGSNLSLERFHCYVAGGRPPGGRHTYPGCRDASPPRADRPLVAEGSVHFAEESTVWGGGMAFYDPARPGPALMRGYLLTCAQLVDVVTQEMHRDPRGRAAEDPPRDVEPLLLAPVRDPSVRAATVALGPGHYETVHRLGRLDGRAVLTMSHGGGAADLRANLPSAAYLRWVVSGLRDAHGLTPGDIADYLLGCPGIGWSGAELARLVDAIVEETSGARDDDDPVPRATRVRPDVADLP